MVPLLKAMGRRHACATHAVPAAFSTLLSLPCHGLHYTCPFAGWHAQPVFEQPNICKLQQQLNACDTACLAPETSSRSGCLLGSSEHAWMLSVSVSYGFVHVFVCHRSPKAVNSCPTNAPLHLTLYPGMLVLKAVELTQNEVLTTGNECM